MQRFSRHKPESVELIRQALTKNNPRRGVKLTAKERKAISDAVKKVWQNPEFVKAWRAKRFPDTKEPS